MKRALVYLFGLNVVVALATPVAGQCPTFPDCNGNGISENCEISCEAEGGACNECEGCGRGHDCNCNNIVDETEDMGDDDCNNNHVPDACDILCGNLSGNCNRCISCAGSTDCNDNLMPDDCDPENVCPTLAVMVVARNGTPLASPQPSITAAPGDMLTIEFYGRCWSMGEPNGFGADTLLGYRLTMAYAGYVSGLTGSILPVAFHDTSDHMHTCPSNNPTGRLPNPENALIDPAHEEYVFEGQDSFPSVNSRTCNYQFINGVLSGEGTRAQLCFVPPEERQPPKYFGTVIVQVSDDADGTFDLCLDTRTNQQGTTLTPFFMGPPPENPQIRPLNFECAAITIEGDGICTRIDSSVPPKNSIDARQPSNLDGSSPAGVAELTIDLTFNPPCSVSDMQPGDFMVTTSAGGTAPSVSMVQVIDTDTVRLVLNGRIPPNNWTKFEYTPPMGDPTSTCLGYLPADVDGNRTANPADINQLVACLAGVQTCEDYQGDANRSGATNPRDILRVADLLNGAQSYDVQNGLTLGSSPCN